MKDKRVLIIISSIILIVLIVIVIVKNKNTEQSSISIIANYTIPKMNITGDIGGMQDKEDKRKIQVKYESNDVNFESYAILKVQGASSLKYDKKNYNITFYEDRDYSKKQKFDVKWGEYSKYTLKANWTDPMHSRNVVTAQIASQINKKYGILTDSVNNGLTDGFPIEIYVNDEFLGLYTLNIHKDYLFNMDKENENSIAIFGSQPRPTAFVSLETEKWNNYEVEIGEQNQETLNKLNRLIEFIINSSDEDFVNDFEKYLNLDSVLNYYCLMEFAHLIDNVTRNIFLVTYDGKIWYMILYDLDYSWGLGFQEMNKITDYENETTEYYIKISPLWKRFRVLFKEQITKRYKELRKDILTKENITGKFNDFYKLIPDETLEKEYKKWNNRPEYERTFINNYLDNQISFFDKKLGLR